MIKFFLILLFVLFSTCSCTQNDVPNVENAPVFGETLGWKGSLAVRDGKVLLLKEDTQYYYSSAEIENAAKIENAVCIHSNRFIQCEDGTFIDLLGSAERNAIYPTVDVINELNETCGIWKIVDSGDSLSEGNWAVYIYANDGTLYSINEIPPEMTVSEIDKTDRIKISSYEKESETEQKIKEGTDFIRIDNALCEVFLKEDGTVECEGFPEVSEWTDIVDIEIYEGVLLGLTADNKVLSAGSDFYAKNVVEFGFIHKGYSIPYALTSDGKLLFGDFSNVTLTPHKDVLTQSSEITDIVAFVYEFQPTAFFLVQKSDGSLWTTTEGIFNPEYVNLYSE